MNYDGDSGMFLYLIPIVCSLCYALSLYIKHNKTLPQQYLALNFLLYGIGMLSCFLYDRYGMSGNRETMRIIDLIINIFGCILILFYFMSLMQPERLTKRYMLSWISGAAVFSMLLLIAGNTLGNPPMSVHDAFTHLESPSVIVRLLAVLITLSLECYVTYVVIQMYRKYLKFSHERYSFDTNVNPRWVAWIILLYIIFGIICIIRDINTSVPIKIAFNVVSLLVITGIFIIGHKRGAVLPLKEKVPQVQKKMKNEPISIVKPSDKQVANNVAIIAYFQQKKPYLNPELTLHEVAAAIGTNTTYLSQLINREFNVNFFTFVNNHRIDYAISLLEQDKELTSEILYSTAGFKSRSVYYKYFRKKTGLSPAEYCKQLHLIQ